MFNSKSNWKSSFLLGFLTCGLFSYAFFKHDMDKCFAFTMLVGLFTSTLFLYLSQNIRKWHEVRIVFSAFAPNHYIFFNGFRVKLQYDEIKKLYSVYFVDNSKTAKYYKSIDMLFQCCDKTFKDNENNIFVFVEDVK